MKDDDFFDEIKKAKREMDVIMEEMMGYPKIMRYSKTYYNPSVDIYETQNNYIILVELPGMKKEDINITMSDDLIIIKGIKKRESIKEDNLCYYHMEIEYGPFERRIRIPRNIDYKKMEVVYENGILKINLPLKVKIIKKIEIE